MVFEVDAQTLRDLNVFAVSKDDFSLYRLFNACKTLGGRDKLASWMKNPTSDIHFLKNRSKALAFLANQNSTWQVENSEVDMVLHHLAQNKNAIRFNPLQVTLAYLGNIFSESQSYYVIKVGVNNLARILSQCENYSAKIKNCGNEYLEQLSARVDQFLGDDLFTRLKSAYQNRIPNFYELIHFNTLVHANKLKVLDLLELVYEIDVLQAVAGTAVKLNYCFPEYSLEKCKVNALELYHPALENPVKNEVLIDNSYNVTFLTGSNMGGKSSLLKAVSIAVYLAHLGFPIPAKSLQISVFDGLITSINLPDNIESGLSHYLSEVKRVKEVLLGLVAGKKLFVVLDELFKGTNAKDASEATELVIRGLENIDGSAFIISSHISELSDRFSSGKIKLLQMEHLTVDDKPIFTYKLKEGVSKDGVGMYFVKQENIHELLEEAKTASAKHN